MNSYARAYDPHSSYFSPRSSEEYRIQMSLNYDGIGASLQLVDDYVTIMNVIEGGPAAVAGTLSVKDRITGVGQGKEGPVTDVLGWRIDDVVQLIRGRAGTQVRLQVLPAGAAPGTPEKTLEFTRNKVTLEAQAAQKELRTIKRGDKEIRVGVINVPAFYQDVEAQNAGDEGIPQHHARRAPAHQRAQGREDRRPGARPARQRRRLSTRSHRAHRPVHRQGPGGAAQGHHRRARSAGRSGTRRRLRRPARGARRSLQRLGLGDLRGRHPGLPPRRRARPAHLRQGHGAEPRAARSLVAAPGRIGQLTVTIGKFYRVTGESTQHRGVEPDVALPSQIDMEEVRRERAAKAPCPGIASPACRSAAKARRSSRTSRRSPPKRKRAPTRSGLSAGWSPISRPPSRCASRPRCRSTCSSARPSVSGSSKERLTRENARRAAQNLPPLKTSEELADAEIPDTVLDQAAEDHDRHGDRLHALSIRRPRARPRESRSRRLQPPVRAASEGLSSWCCS